MTENVYKYHHSLILSEVCPVRMETEITTQYVKNNITALVSRGMRVLVTRGKTKTATLRCVCEGWKFGGSSEK
jgi:hypothetical protein